MLGVGMLQWLVPGLKVRLRISTSFSFQDLLLPENCAIACHNAAGDVRIQGPGLQNQMQRVCKFH